MSRFSSLGPNLFRWSDTGNVYVLRYGEQALLIDLGDGSVLPSARLASRTSSGCC
jgi:hypothetical protein